MKNDMLLIAVLSQLEREGSVSIPQLAKLLDTDEQAIADALEILVFAYDAAAVRLDLHNTYATLVTNHPEQLLRLTASETDVLIDALLGAGLSPEDELVRKLLETKSLLDESSGVPQPRLRVVGEGVRAEVAQTVASSCEDESHHLLRISYRGENDATSQG